MHFEMWKRKTWLLFFWFDQILKAKQELVPPPMPEVNAVAAWSSYRGFSSELFWQRNLQMKGLTCCWNLRIWPKKFLLQLKASLETSPTLATCKGKLAQKAFPQHQTRASLAALVWRRVFILNNNADRHRIASWNKPARTILLGPPSKCTFME